MLSTLAQTILLVSLATAPDPAFVAEEPADERAWSARLAEDIGVPPEDVEFRLPDGARVDILDRQSGIAWEVEWSDKHAEAIGQSVYYALATNQKPGVWLLLRGNHDEDYLRCLMVCRELGIELRTTKTSRK